MTGKKSKKTAAATANKKVSLKRTVKKATNKRVPAKTAKKKVTAKTAKKKVPAKTPKKKVTAKAAKKKVTAQAAKKKMTVKAVKKKVTAKAAKKRVPAKTAKKKVAKRAATGKVSKKKTAGTTSKPAVEPAAKPAAKPEPQEPGLPLKEVRARLGLIGPQIADLDWLEGLYMYGRALMEAPRLERVDFIVVYRGRHGAKWIKAAQVELRTLLEAVLPLDFELNTGTLGVGRLLSEGNPAAVAHLGYAEPVFTRSA